MSDKLAEYGYESPEAYDSSVRPAGYDNEDVFGHEENHDARTPHTALLMDYC